MKKSKKILSLVLVFAMCLSMSAMAVESGDTVVLTQEQEKQIAEHNILIEDYVASKMMLRSASNVLLPVTSYQQETTYYCGAASAQMVIKYLNNSLVSQTTLASQIGITAAGCSIDQIENCLNNYYNLNYQYVNVSNSTFGNSLIYSIDAGYPLICNVSQMPDYYTDGHFIVATGYFAGFSGNSWTSDVYYNDPHYNNSYYGSHVMSVSEMVSAISSTYGWYMRYAE